ncbi:hypothetical protein IE53DRAFT_383172 [Violaceomyces palustris]|uniref:Uncharacterized protein n=1 Tax=Violaceomyces palustris TaxID=1673888 RepID=A0ACD0P886_9BASI|nr:hypothetical protein IE53DRAFT_383172 [Violaceomyces palustris]
MDSPDRTSASATKRRRTDGIDSIDPSRPSYQATRVGYHDSASPSSLSTPPTLAHQSARYTSYTRGRGGGSDAESYPSTSAEHTPNGPPPSSYTPKQTSSAKNPSNVSAAPPVAIKRSDSGLGPDTSVATLNSTPPNDGKPRGGQACLECRLAKVRCLPSPDSDANSCQRCQRFNFECLFVQHKRGRKPKSKLAGRDLSLLAEAATASPANVQATSYKSHARLTSQGQPAGPSSRHAQSQSQSDFSPGSAFSPPLRDEFAASSRADTGSMAIDPSLTSEGADADTPATPRHVLGVDLVRMTRAMHQAMRSQDRRRGAPYTLVSIDNNPALESSERNSATGTAEPQDTNVINESFELIAEQPLTLSVMLKPFEICENPVTDDRRKLHDDRMTSGAQQRDELNDPVTSGILTEAAARSLFDLFMLHANGWSEVFDPALHTHDWVRRRSSFLYSTMLYVGARFSKDPAGQGLEGVREWKRRLGMEDSDYLSPNSASTPGQTTAGDGHLMTRGEEELLEYARYIRQQLQVQARDHAARAFVDGDRTVACCQAFFLLASWKSLDDGLSVIQCGYAFRLAMDIQLFAEMPQSIKPKGMLDVASQQRFEAVQRRFRNRQRTFLMLFVQDKTQQISNKITTHSISAENPLIRMCQVWHRKAGAIPGDAYVSASVDMRRIQAKYVELVDRMEALSGMQGEGPNILLPAFISELGEWWQRWLDALGLKPMPGQEEEDPAFPNRKQCRRSNMKFWKDSVKLHIASSILKYSLKQAAMTESKGRKADRDEDGWSPQEGGDDSSAALVTEGGAYNLINMPAFWPCVEGARGVLHAINSMPPERLLTTPDSTALQTTHAAVLLCSLATVKSVPPLGKGYISSTIQLIDKTSAAFRRASISPDDTVVHIARYLESLLRPLDAVEKSNGRNHAGMESNAVSSSSSSSCNGQYGNAMPLDPNLLPSAGGVTTAPQGGFQQMEISNITWPQTTANLNGGGANLQNMNGRNDFGWNYADPSTWASMTMNPPQPNLMVGQDQSDETLQMLLRFLDG